MKRWQVVMCALFAAALVVTLPAAAGAKERIGSQLFLFPSAPATFPADQPFHIAHGWLVLPDWSDYDAIGKRLFALEVDGQRVEPDFVERTSDDGVLRRIWVFNFPEGLPAGTHTFTAWWSSACQAAADSGLYPGTCRKPTEMVVAIAPLTRIIEFTP